MQRRRPFLAVLAACALAWFPALSVAYIPPPEPLRISFTPGRAALDAAGLAQVDRAAVRAAQCVSEPVRFVIWHEASASPGLLAERAAVFRKRLQALGITPARYRDRTLRPHRRGARLGADELVVEVLDSEDGEYCSSSNGPLMVRWAEQMGRELAAAPHAMPTLWRRMSSEVRRDELPLLLARAALCADADADSPVQCKPQVAVVWWLVDHVAKCASAKVRQDWLRMMWEAGSDDELTRFTGTVRAAPLEAGEKVYLVPQLAQGKLPWQTIERRLLEPGVMQELARQPFWASETGPVRSTFLIAALMRHEYESIGRLLEASADMRACYVADALEFSRWQQEFYSLVKADWTGLAQGLQAHRTDAGREPRDCDVTQSLLRLAACGAYSPKRWTAPLPDGPAVWHAFIEAGFVVNEASVREALARPMQDMQGQCQVERVEGVPMAELPFRRVSNPGTPPAAKPE